MLSTFACVESHCLFVRRLLPNLANMLRKLSACFGLHVDAVPMAYQRTLNKSGTSDPGCKGTSILFLTSPILPYSPLSSPTLPYPPLLSPILPYSPLSSPTLPLSICTSPTPLYHLQGPHSKSDDFSRSRLTECRQLPMSPICSYLNSIRWT
jgi:hypothetical protein